MDSVFCPNCGEKRIEGGKFCRKCGKKFEVLSPSVTQTEKSPSPPQTKIAPVSSTPIIENTKNSKNNISKNLTIKNQNNVLFYIRIIISIVVVASFFLPWVPAKYESISGIGCAINIFIQLGHMFKDGNAFLSPVILRLISLSIIVTPALFHIINLFIMFSKHDRKSSRILTYTPLIIWFVAILVGILIGWGHTLTIDFTEFWLKSSGSILTMLGLVVGLCASLLSTPSRVSTDGKSKETSERNLSKFQITWKEDGTLFYIQLIASIVVIIAFFIPWLDLNQEHPSISGAGLLMQFFEKIKEARDGEIILVLGVLAIIIVPILCHIGNLYVIFIARKRKLSRILTRVPIILWFITFFITVLFAVAKHSNRGGQEFDEAIGMLLKKGGVPLTMLGLVVGMSASLLAKSSGVSMDKKQKGVSDCRCQEKVK